MNKNQENKHYLEARNITKSYKDGSSVLKVLKGVSLECGMSEIIIIRGPSGSGKTTLLNILSTLDAPDNSDADIYYDNMRIEYKDLDQLEIQRSRNIGIVFQDHYLLEEFTILENLKLPYCLNNITDHYDPIKLLETVNLESKASKYPNQLSGGEKQRVALLRAIINKPKIIFADEPTGNLDGENILNMSKLILEFNSKHKTSFIIATHDAKICDIGNKIYCLDDGILTLENRN